MNFPLYDGNKSACDNCLRKFNKGENISVDRNYGFVFCYSDAYGGCVPAYAFATGRVIIATSMQFGEGNLSNEERAPNYPHSPVFEKSGIDIPRKKWWQKLFGV